MTAIKLLHVERFTDRHGHTRHYFRRGKGARTPLPGLPGSTEFMAAYATALKAITGGRAGTVHPRSVTALVTQYLQSPRFLRLRPSSQYCTRKVMERIAAEHGKGLIPEMTLTHVEKIIGAKADTPAAANTLLKRLRTLINYSIKLGWRQTDPTKSVEKFKEGEYHTWTDDELAAYESRWPLGTMQRTAYDLALYTGQRRADVARMTWADIERQVIRVVQSKTDAKLAIPIHTNLARTLKAWPRKHVAILASNRGAPYTTESFGNAMAAAIEAAGLPERCVFHGLRKAAARRLAEAGCTPHQIAAITGHKGLEEVERYTRAVTQSKLASQAILKLPQKRVGAIQNKQRKTK